MNDEGSEDQTLMIQRAIFGKQVEVFFNSDIGKYLIGRALEQKEEAQYEFTKADCTNISEMLKIQNRIIVADSVVGWLRDAVEDGLQALNIIEDRS